MFGYAHNGVLEICLQLGLVGTALFFVTLVQAIGNAWFCLRNGCPPAVEWYIGIIALTLVYNIDESTVLWPIDLLSAYLCRRVLRSRYGRPADHRQVERLRLCISSGRKSITYLTKRNRFLNSAAERSPGGSPMC